MFARGPTATFLDAWLWKFIYVLYQWPDVRPKPLFQYLACMTSTWYWIRSSNYAVLALGPPYWYIIPPHICYPYAYILLRINTWIDCTTVTVVLLPPVAVTDTNHWQDRLLLCSRYWTFITTTGWCCLFLKNTFRHDRIDRRKTMHWSRAADFFCFLHHTSNSSTSTLPKNGGISDTVPSPKWHINSWIKPITGDGREPPPPPIQKPKTWTTRCRLPPLLDRTERRGQ